MTQPRIIGSIDEIVAMGTTRLLRLRRSVLNHVVTWSVDNYRGKALGWKVVALASQQCPNPFAELMAWMCEANQEIRKEQQEKARVRKPRDEDPYIKYYIRGEEPDPVPNSGTLPGANGGS